jgi:outer membrane protein TolC
VKHGIRLVATGVAILVFASIRPCAEEVRWDLAQALEAAIQHNRTLQQRRLDVEETRQLLADTWNLFLPSLGAGASVSRSEPVSSADSPWTVGVSLSSSLSLSAVAKSRIDDARIKYDSSLLSFEKEVAGLRRSVKTSFYEILLAEERIELARQNIELARRQYENTEALYQSGRASELDLLAALVTWENEKPELLALEHDRASQLADLKNLAGLDRDDDLLLSGSIRAPVVSLDRDQLDREAEQASLPIRELRAELAELEIGRQLASRSERAPTVSLSYSYAPSFGGPLDQSISDKGNWIDGTLRLSLSVPLDPHIPHSRGDNAVRAYDYDIRRAELALEQALGDARSEVAALLDELEGIRRTIQALEFSIEQAERSYEQTLASYEQGGKQLLEVENALNALQRARLGVLDETYNYVTTLVDLEYLVGRSLVEE